MKIRTLHTITVAVFPVLCQSKLKTETALSNMEVEIISMDHIRKELSPIMDMVDISAHQLGLPVGDATMDVLTYE